MLGIIAIHCILLYTLYTLRPDKVDNAHFIFPAQNEQITRITFITRPAKKLIGSKNPKNTSASAPLEINQHSQKRLQADFIARNPKKPETESARIVPSDSLILSLPEAKLDFSPKARDLMERPRNTVEYKATRFNSHWKPSGNVVDSLKWKSKTVNTVLGLFGGNRKLCTDEDKKNSIAGCVPNGYRPENDTSLPIQ